MRDRAYEPSHPVLVLAAAILLPGTGQVLNGQSFMLLLGGYTLQTAAETVSIVGKLSGGLFVYAMSIFDAYKTARIRKTVYDHGRSEAR